MLAYLFYFLSAQAAPVNCNALNTVRFEIPGVQLIARTVQPNELKDLMALVFGSRAVNFDSGENDKADETAKLVWTNHFEPLLDGRRLSYSEMANINQDSKNTIYNSRTDLKKPYMDYFKDPAHYFVTHPFAIVTVGLFSGAKLIGFASIYKHEAASLKLYGPHFKDHTVFITVALSRQTKRLAEVTEAAIQYAIQQLKMDQIIVPLPVGRKGEELARILNLAGEHVEGTINYMWRNKVPFNHSAAGND